MSDTDPVSTGSQKRLYMDVCALNRPLDDQVQMRIRLETDAVSLILSCVRAGVISLAVSPAHRVETLANPDPAKREHVWLLLDEIGTDASVDLPQARRRAEQLHSAGFGPADATHVAFAELSGCDFVTVDDRLLRQLSRVRVKVWFGTPLAYCDKENLR